MKSFTVSQGVYSISKENLFRGQLPRQIVFNLVKNEFFNRTIGKNSFNFKHSSGNFVFLYRDEEQIPFNPLQLNYSQNGCIQSYCHFLLVLDFTSTTQEMVSLVRRIQKAYSVCI